MRHLGQIIGRVKEARKAEDILLGFFVTAIVVVVFCGVFFRYSPISGQTLWTAELARFFLLFTAFLAAGSIERVGGHFRVDLLDKHLSSGKWLFLQLFKRLVILVSMGILIWWIIAYSKTAMGIVTLLLQWPWVIRPIALLLGSLLLFTYLLTDFIQILRKLGK